MGELSVAPDDAARFVPVAVATESCVAPAMENDKRPGSRIKVVLRNGRVLRLSEEVAPQLVGQLADALDGCGR